VHLRIAKCRDGCDLPFCNVSRSYPRQFDGEGTQRMWRSDSRFPAANCSPFSRQRSLIAYRREIVLCRDWYIRRLTKIDVRARQAACLLLIGWWWICILIDRQFEAERALYLPVNHVFQISKAVDVRVLMKTTVFWFQTAIWKLISNNHRLFYRSR